MGGTRQSPATVLGAPAQTPGGLCRVCELPGSEQHVDSRAWLLSDPVHPKEGSSSTKPERNAARVGTAPPNPVLVQEAELWCGHACPQPSVEDQRAQVRVECRSPSTRETLPGAGGCPHSHHLPAVQAGDCRVIYSFSSPVKSLGPLLNEVTVLGGENGERGPPSRGNPSGGNLVLCLLGSTLTSFPALSMLPSVFAYVKEGSARQSASSRPRP